jgi:hypothetical protein
MSIEDAKIHAAAYATSMNTIRVMTTSIAASAHAGFNSRNHRAPDAVGRHFMGPSISSTSRTESVVPTWDALSALGIIARTSRSESDG